MTNQGSYTLRSDLGFLHTICTYKGNIRKHQGKPAVFTLYLNFTPHCPMVRGNSFWNLLKYLCKLLFLNVQRTFHDVSQCFTRFSVLSGDDVIINQLFEIIGISQGEDLCLITVENTIFLENYQKGWSDSLVLHWLRHSAGMPGAGVMVRVVGLGSKDPEFKSHSAVDKINIRWG